MQKRIAKLSLLAVLALMLALCLLATAGPASATTTNTITWSMAGVLDDGIDLPPGVDGTYYGLDWVPYAQIYRATGPDGWRFLGYGVACLDTRVPPKGNNYHWGEMAWLSKDPGAAGYWDDQLSFGENLANHAGDLLWTGTWDGFTRNKYNHHVIVALTGWPESYNKGYTAIVEMHCGQIDVAPRSGHYVGTPWNGVALVTAL